MAGHRSANLTYKGDRAARSRGGNDLSRARKQTEEFADQRTACIAAETEESDSEPKG